jgi:hypothetical protein
MFSRLLCIIATDVTYFWNHLSLARLQLLSDRFPIRKLLLPSPLVVNLRIHQNSQCLLDPHKLAAKVKMLPLIYLLCSADYNTAQAKPRSMNY